MFLKKYARTEQGIFGLLATCGILLCRRAHIVVTFESVNLKFLLRV